MGKQKKSSKVHTSSKNSDPNQLSFSPLFLPDIFQRPGIFFPRLRTLIRNLGFFVHKLGIYTIEHHGQPNRRNPRRDKRKA